MNFYGIYKKTRNSSWQVLIDYKISSLPVNVVEIADKAGISIIKNCEVNELRENEFGLTIFENNQCYIIYDETMSKSRIRFTIAHELGHIFLGFPLAYDLNSSINTFNKEKPIVESEADMFAIRLLAPACVIWGLQLKTADEIMDYCQISRQAAEIRLERMELLYKRNMFLKSPLEKQVFNQFKNYIELNKK